MELAVYNINGQDTGKKVTLNDEVFAIAEPNEHAVYLSVKQYLGNQRQGTHKSKERSEIMGSTKKLGRQKGGGGARTVTSSRLCSTVEVVSSVHVHATITLSSTRRLKTLLAARHSPTRLKTTRS